MSSTGKIPINKTGSYWTTDKTAALIVDKMLAERLIETDEKIWEPSMGGGSFVRAARARCFSVEGMDLAGDSFVTDSQDVPSGEAVRGEADPDEIKLAMKQLKIPAQYFVDLYVGSLRWDPLVKPDVIMGNPPYSLLVQKRDQDGVHLFWTESAIKKLKKKELPSVGDPIMKRLDNIAALHIRRGMLLRPRRIIQLLRISFIETDTRRENVFSSFDLEFRLSHLYSFSRRPGFIRPDVNPDKPTGTDSAAYGVFVWSRGWPNEWYRGLII